MRNGTRHATSGGMTRLLLSLLLVGAVACSRSTDAPPPSPPPSVETTSLPAGLQRVGDRSLVCMVNDQFMGRPQIPVQVEARTYYGCCPACKDKLEQQPGVRTARDPVTGETVDKATAVIVQDPQGKVLYFASEETLRRFGG